MKRIFFLSLICSLLLSGTARTETLQVLYLERPPYYFTVNGRAEGFLVRLSQKLFRKAEIQATFMEMPPKRIIKMLKHTDGRFCSIGWFKTPEREKFAKFSLPIYRNKPIVLLTATSQKEKFKPYRTLKEIFSDKSLVLGSMSAFSYGDYIDTLMQQNTPSKIEITSRQSMIPEMIIKQRVHYMLIAPEEIESLLQLNGYSLTAFSAIRMPDIPAGNKRYLIFNKGVSDDLIDRINQAITTQIRLENTE